MSKYFDEEIKKNANEKFKKHIVDILTIKDNQIADLEAKLAEKEKELEEVKQHRTQILNFGKRAKKVVIVNPYGEDCVVYNQEDQDKISFAVDKLVGIQKYISDNAVYIEEESFGREINDFIDNQIKQLKEGNV